MADEPAQTSNEKQVILQKIYVQDLSFESPKAPQIFATNVQAETQLNVSTKNRQLEADQFEVCLTLTITSKNNEDTLFLIEIAQAGVFTIRGYSDQERHMLLGSFCPGTLFPFAREAVADIASKGGFPQLLLQPINFDAVYAQALQQQQQQQAAAMQTAPVQPAGLEAGPTDISVETAPKGDGETH